MSTGKRPIKIGVQYSHWLVLEDAGQFKSGHLWLCLCTLCGVTRSKVREYALRNKKSRHCLSCNPGRPTEVPDAKVGDKVGWWTVVAEAESARDPRGRKSFKRVLCQCRCGTRRILRQTQLKRAGTRFSSLSCGCGRSYHAAVTMMLKHQNIMSPSVKAMFSHFEKERSDDGIDRKHASASSNNTSHNTGLDSVA
jgi:hypothetical protein